MFRKAFGILLAGLAISLGVSYFYKTYQEGNPSWNFLILAFGMLFLIYYTLIGSSKKKKE